MCSRTGWASSLVSCSRLIVASALLACHLVFALQLLRLFALARDLVQLFLAMALDRIIAILLG